MLHPNFFSKTVVPLAGAHLSRRLVDFWTEPELLRVQNLINGENGLNVRPFQMQTDQPLLSLEAIISNDIDQIVSKIFRYLDGKIDSTEIYKIKKLLEAHGVEEAVLQRLDALSTEMHPISPGEAWEKQDLSDNCVPTLISVVSKQHGIYSDEGLATLRTLISEAWGHEPVCIDLGIFVKCADGSSEVGVTASKVEAAFEANSIPVSRIQVSSLDQLDALLESGRTVCLLLDARPLWAPLSEKVAEFGAPMGHIVQVTGKTADGEGYIFIDTGHDLGREIVYSKAQLMKGWRLTDFAAIVTDNPVPGRIDGSAHVEPTAKDSVQPADTYDYEHIYEYIHDPEIETAIEGVEALANANELIEVTAAEFEAIPVMPFLKPSIGQIVTDTPVEDAEAEVPDFVTD